MFSTLQMYVFCSYFLFFFIFKYRDYFLRSIKHLCSLMVLLLVLHPCLIKKIKRGNIFLFFYVFCKWCLMSCFCYFDLILPSLCHHSVCCLGICPSFLFIFFLFSPYIYIFILSFLFT